MLLILIQTKVLVCFVLFLVLVYHLINGVNLCDISVDKMVGFLGMIACVWCAKVSHFVRIEKFHFFPEVTCLWIVSTSVALFECFKSHSRYLRFTLKFAIIRLEFQTFKLVTKLIYHPRHNSPDWRKNWPSCFLLLLQLN